MKGNEFRSKIAGRIWRIRYEDAKTMGKDCGR